MTLVRETLLLNQRHPWTDEGNCDHLWLEHEDESVVESALNQKVRDGWSVWIFGTNSVTHYFTAVLLKFTDRVT